MSKGYMPFAKKKKKQKLAKENSEGATEMKGGSETESDKRTLR